MSTSWTEPTFSSAIVASSNQAFRRKILESLRSPDCNVLEARGGAEALAKLGAGGCDALFLDRWLYDLDVEELLGIVRARHPGVKVVVLDAEADGESAGREGVHSASSAPGTDSAGPTRSFAPQTAPAAAAAVRAPAPIEPLPGMIGVSPAMREVCRLSRLVAPRSTTVLLTGETGTGKELVAKAIHTLSPRQKQPFITVNCAAIPEALLEAELFGYARGAFTGAFQSRMGRIHAAHGGTLFLDEVGELPLSMQAKLLRFLQEGEVQRLGSPDIVRTDVRVIAATNAHLAKRVAEKAFREDLYYRIAVFPVDLVPLRERAQDIPPLGAYFLDEFCREAGVSPKTVSSGASRMLTQHVWPGNVRELRHVIERAFILSESASQILPEHVSLEMPWH